MPFLFTLLTFILASLLGAAAAFAQTNPFGGGAGTEGMPYQISTIAHLNAIRDNSDSSGEDYLARGLYFALMNDLDFEDTDGNGADYVYSDVSDTENDKGWLPIGHDTMPGSVGGGVSLGFQGTRFSGSFDGDGHVIRNLLISRADEDFIGLFGELKFGSSVKNLGVEGVNVEGKETAGGLVGSIGQGTITSCYSTGSVTGVQAVGGLVGNSSNTPITSCYSTADVTGSTFVGGLVGLGGSTVITSCYSTGSVTRGGTSIGGFLGLNFFDSGTVSASYWENTGIDDATDDTDRTPTQMRALTLADLGDTGGLSWAVGTANQYPALRTYKLNDSDVQVQGDVIAGQPCPRAGGCSDFGGGSGTEDDPYQISTIRHLNSIRGEYLDDHYILMNDLDFAGSIWGDDDTVSGYVSEGWLPIGHDTDQTSVSFDGSSFEGSFDGQGHVISNLRIDREEELFIGLFGSVNRPGSIANLGLVGLDVTGKTFVGGLVGQCVPCNISSCYSTAEVSGDVSVGGLVGAIQGADVMISSCYSTAEVSGNSAVGGLVGQQVRGTIQSCYFSGEAREGDVVKGLVGQEVIADPINESYWENPGAAIDDATDATDRTSAQMKALTGDTSGWGELSWHFGDDEKYPALRTYEEMPAGTQVQGSVICGQPSPRAVCEPGVSISAASGGESVAEGEDAAFTLTREGTATPDLIVTVSVEGWEGFQDTTPATTVTFTGTTVTATYSVSTLNDMVDEADGMITVTVDDASGDYAAKQGMGSATVGVMDDDLPEVSIAAVAPSVTEGTDAEFTLTRVGDTTAALTVMVTVTGGDSFLSGGDTTEAIFGAGEATVTLSLTTDDDDMDEADGMITATIPASDATYRLGTATATVNIADDDPILVSITGATSTEGAGAVFTLMRARAEAGALAVKVTVDAGTGDFLTDPLMVTEGDSTTALALVSGSVTVTIAADQDSQTFTVSTDDDTADEADGTVTATIIAEADGPYRVHATDADVLMASVEVGVTDNDLPLVSIAAGTSPVTEGTAAEFTLTREGVITEALTVTVSVTGGDGFLSGTAPTEAVFGAGDGTATLSLATEGDDMDEEDGMIEATVTAIDGSYRVDGTVTASVAVTDDDLPSITSFEIEGSSGSIAEDADPKTITVTVTEGTSLADLDPTVVTVRSDATVAPAGAVTFVDGIAQDFTVTAGGDTVTYQVTVNVVVGTPPGVPGGFSAVAGVEQVTLSWTEPTELGSTGTLSKYEYRQTQGVDVSPWTAVAPPTGLTQVVGSLTADVVYGFEVRAVGSNGLAGDATAKEEATPLAVGGLMFSETIANQTYTENTAITDLELPVATGGMGTLTYTLTPVPDGLMFDATNRTLSGTPTMPTTTTHTYTVTDSTPVTELTESMTFTITVNEEGSPTFADTIANQTYTENTAITDLVLPVATGGMGSLTYALTPVPDGLEFDATNRTLSGTPTIPTPTPTTHTYTVTDSTPDTALTAALTFTITVSEEAETIFGIGSQGSAVHVYPNPAGDVLHIEFSGAGEYGIALLTVTGQQVFGGQHAGGGTKKLDVSTLKGGVYFLKIEDGEGVSHTVRILR